MSDATRITTPSPQELAISKSFDAPRAQVFDTWTRPELLRRWLLGPPGWTFGECTVDLRVGGTYRFVWVNDQDGRRLGMGGSYLEVVRGERIVHTERFDVAWYPGEAVVTTTFVEADGATATTSTIRYESAEARDAVLRSGMEQGLTASHDRLDALLAADASRPAS